MRNPHALFAAMLLVLAQSCAGPDLRKEKVAAVEPLLVANSYCPGRTAYLEVRVRLENGKVLLTEGKARGSVSWKNFKVSSEVVTVGRNGRVLFPEDPRAYLNAAPVIRIETAGHPDRNTLVPVPIRWDCEYLADFSGGNGAHGSSGSHGQDATAESAATNGESGTSGDAGGSAEDVQVRVTLVHSADGVPFLQVSARGLRSRGEHLFAIDTRGGNLTVLATGGHGGHGGDGGEAGKGKSAGGGGSGGHGGDGGNITLVISEEAAAFERLIRFETTGGKGGKAGRNAVGSGILDVVAAIVLTPSDGDDGRSGRITVHREPVSPLW